MSESQDQTPRDDLLAEIERFVDDQAAVVKSTKQTFAKMDALFSEVLKEEKANDEVARQTEPCQDDLSAKVERFVDDQVALREAGKQLQAKIGDVFSELRKEIEEEEEEKLRILLGSEYAAAYIQMDPENAERYSTRGDVYKEEGELDKAIADYTEAVRLDPEYAKRYSDRGDAYKENGELDKAIADYTKAVRLDPKNAERYGTRGDAYKENGDFDKAIADYTEAIRFECDYYYYGPFRRYIVRGDAYKEHGEWDKAIDDYTEAIKDNPYCCVAYHYRGDVYAGKGEWDKAIADYTEALRRYSESHGDWETYRDHGMVYDNEGVTQLHLKLAAAYHNRGMDYPAKGDMAKAEMNFVRVKGAQQMSDNPVKVQTYLVIAEAQVEAGDMDEARKTVDLAKETAALLSDEGEDNDKSLVCRGIAVAQAAAGDIAGARETAADIRNNFYKWWAYDDIVKIQTRAGDMAGAKETVTMSNLTPHAYRGIVEAQAKAGDVAGAKETAALISDEGDKVWACRDIAVAQAEAGDMDGARKTCDPAKEAAAKISKDRDKSSAYMVIAVTQAEAGDIAGAWETMALISDENDKEGAYQIIAVAQAEAGDMDEAIKTAALISDKNDKKWAYRAIAEAHARAKGGDKVK